MICLVTITSLSSGSCLVRLPPPTAELRVVLSFCWIVGTATGGFILEFQMPDFALLNFIGRHLRESTVGTQLWLKEQFGNTISRIISNGTFLQNRCHENFYRGWSDLHGYELTSQIHMTIAQVSTSRIVSPRLGAEGRGRWGISKEFSTYPRPRG